VSVVAFDPLLDKAYQATALGRAIVDFIAWCELGGMAARTLDQYERDLARGALMFVEKGPASLSDEDALHIARSFSPGQRRVRVASWRSFYKWAVRARLADRNPFDALPVIKRTPQRTPDLFSDAEVEALVGLPIVDGAPMALLFDAGPRKADARHFRLRNYRADTGMLVMLRGKGGKDRLVPASSRVVRMLNELALVEGLEPDDHLWYSVQAGPCHRHLRRRNPVGDRSFDRWWERCLETAGVPYRNPHVARHTFATNWLRHGGRLETLSLVLGHASIRTTFDLYGHLDMTDVAADLELVEGDMERVLRKVLPERVINL